jgi:hypothetical protein
MTPTRLKERRVHAGLDVDFNISPIYDVSDQSRGGFFIGFGGSLIFLFYQKSGYYNARVVEIIGTTIINEGYKEIFFPGGQLRLVKLSVVYNLFDLFSIDEPGYQYNYSNKIGLIVSIAPFGISVGRPQR